MCVYILYVNYMFVFFTLTFCYLHIAYVLIIVCLDDHTEFRWLLVWSLTPYTFAEDGGQLAQVIITTLI
jgi:hypothetical protein